MPVPRQPDADPIADYRHTDATRKNIPPAGLAAQGRIKESTKLRYEYDPHRPPVLRFDPTGGADCLPELLETARQRALTADETRLLADALRNHQPWLEWAGKREAKACEVDPVALHIHERVSAQAILRVAARQDVPRTLFADPEQEYREAVQFYQHEVKWSNRLILGDSLAVMASLARREDLAGKVQMIYIDPPYGIKFKSNFQSEISNRDVKERPEDLTREPETVKAYRDTWTLGVHSYLAYLRDRLYAAKELLADSGSVFVQISDENIHRVRTVMDEVFGASNHVVDIIVKKKGSQKGGSLEPINDYLIWYAKDRAQALIRSFFVGKSGESDTPDRFDAVELPTGELRRLSSLDSDEFLRLRMEGAQLLAADPLTSGGEFRTQRYTIKLAAKQFEPPKNNSWKLAEQPMRRVVQASRILLGKSGIRFKKYLGDFDRAAITNMWDDLAGAMDKKYVVQTNTTVVERCLLMTTRPGDLVLDPTCGSGTTAFVAEQWARRWITIDASRVALAIARQRLLTAKFDYYALRPVTADEISRNKDGTWLNDPRKEISGPCAFNCKTVPHITLKSIGQNQALDPIFAKWEVPMAERLNRLNECLSQVTPSLRRELQLKLQLKRKRRDRNDPVTDADERRWQLPESSWNEWEVPFDTDPDWPIALQEALIEYRKSWRAKMDEVNACIAACAEQEELVDQPEVDRRILRVSGPFTVEGVMPAEESLSLVDEPGFEGDLEELETFASQESHPPGSNGAAAEPVNTEAYLDKMLRLLRGDGVRFPDNKTLKFARLERPETGGDVIHAEGTWENGDGDRRVGVTFGPQYGPITAKMVEETLRAAYRRGFDEVVFAGFTFDAAAQAAIQEDPNPQVRVHLAHIRPDVNMGDLLKNTSSSQLFTVSGLPRVKSERTETGEYVATMEGVDIYDPVGNSIIATGASKVAAWFLDSDYDGRTFCVCQAFFPDPKAWEKLSRALSGVVDADRFSAFSGTRSLPFPVGKHARAAVKVIDPRGNEVMRVLRLDGSAQYA